MTREHKISLIVGFALVLLVAVAVSDHLSNARSATLETDMLTADAGWSASPASLPAPTPIDVYAPAPTRAIETPQPADQPQPGPIERGLTAANRVNEANATDETTSSRAADFLDRLRNRFEAMPLAMETDRARPAERTPAPASTVNTTPTADIPVVWHSIEDGDSLWSISQRHYGDGSLAGKLAEFNGSRAANPDLIRVGVRLRIPPKSVLTGAASDSSPAVAPANKPDTKPETKPASNPAPTEHRLYKIKPGDTLGAIAMRELGTIRRAPEIVALNPKTLADPDIVPVGVSIRLPAK